MGDRDATCVTIELLYIYIKMDIRIRMQSSFPMNNGQDLGTMEDRIHEMSRFFDQYVAPVAVPVAVPAGMIPYEQIYCHNEEDPVSLEPFVPGSYVSIYHSKDAREGFEKPTCLDIEQTIDWLESRPAHLDVVTLPIEDQFSYNVPRDGLLPLLRGPSVGLRPLLMYSRLIGHQVEPVYRLIPFIPPNFPLQNNRGEYPYDMIRVRTPHAPYYEIHVQRHKLVNRIYQNVLGLNQSDLIPIRELEYIAIRVRREGYAENEQSSLDVLSNPAIIHFKIRRETRCIARRMNDRP